MSYLSWPYLMGIEIALGFKDAVTSDVLCMVGRDFIAYVFDRSQRFNNFVLLGKAGGN